MSYTSPRKTYPEGQVRIRVTLSPIHNHDIWTIRGTYGFVPDLPAHAGTEVLGTVDALGPGVSGLVAGQRVVSGTSFGTWSEYALIDAAGAIPVPDQLTAGIDALQRHQPAGLPRPERG